MTFNEYDKVILTKNISEHGITVNSGTCGVIVMKYSDDLYEVEFPAIKDVFAVSSDSLILAETSYKELDQVILTKPVTDRGVTLPAGTIGIVLLIYSDIALEIGLKEFDKTFTVPISSVE